MLKSGHYCQDMGERITAIRLKKKKKPKNFQVRSTYRTHDTASEKTLAIQYDSSWLVSRFQKLCWKRKYGLHFWLLQNRF